MIGKWLWLDFLAVTKKKKNPNINLKNYVQFPVFMVSFLLYELSLLNTSLFSNDFLLQPFL